MFRGDQRREFARDNGAEASSQRRTKDRLELRKSKRDQANREKRRKRITNNNNCQLDLNQLDPSTQERLKNLDQMAKYLRSGTTKEKEETVEHIRKLLSIEKTPPIQAVINAGIVGDLMSLLKDKSNSMKARFEAAWALTNIASGSSQQTKIIVDNGGVEIFVDILKTENGDIKEQSVWGIGNIAGDCAELRDRVLRTDALPVLLQIFKDHQQNLGLLRNATWTLCNFCRGKPNADLEILRPCLPLLVNLLQVDDDEILMDTCWAVSYVSDDPTTSSMRIAEVIKMGFVPHLIRLLGHNNSLIVHPALRALGNMVTGDDNQTQRVIEYGALPKLKALLDHGKKEIRKEACWAISNITAGNVEQIESVIRADVMKLVLIQLKSTVFEIRKEATWAISNATAGGNNQQIKYLCDIGCVPPLIKIIQFANPKTIRVALEGIMNILKAGSDNNPNPVVNLIEEVGGFGIIGALNNNLCDNIRDKILGILMFDPSRSCSTGYGNNSEELNKFELTAGNTNNFNFGGTSSNQQTNNTNNNGFGGMNNNTHNNNNNNNNFNLFGNQNNNQ